MKELGSDSRKCHQEVVLHAMDAEVSLVLTYGPECSEMKGDEDMPVYHFDSREALHDLVKVELKAGDVVLVKGSRSMKMEETVDFINAH